jgi:hypothetical protein
MNNINNKIIVMGNTISGSYSSNTNDYTDNIFYNNLCNDNFYISNLNNLIQEKKHIESQISNFENINLNLLHYINFLKKRYYCINITHNNTINFIYKNNLQIKLLLEKYISIYNENINNIYLFKEKNSIINSLIESFLFILKRDIF